MPYRFNPFTGNFDYYEAGSGSADLATVLTNGNESGPLNIEFDSGYGVVLDNNSRLKEGTFDHGTGGLKGIAQICAVGYELKWEAGRLYVMQSDGFTIRWSLYNFSAPGVGDDSSLGYVVGSRFIVDNGDTYECTDATPGAAVWSLEAGVVPTLAQVLAAGNTANNLDIIDIDKLDFNTGTSDTAGEGQLTWNDALGTLNLGLKGGNTLSNVGQHLHARVVNKTTPLVPLTKAGYQVVIVSGAAGQRLAVRLAKADNDANSAGTLGVVCENIAVNQEGFICSVGLLTKINTTGSLQGETWADGDSLYLSPTVFGGVTNIKPSAPDHEVRIGYVEYAHGVNGKIYVKIDNGYEIDELHNVLITSVAKGNYLEYDGVKWVNKNIVYTIELIDVLTVDFYAPYDLKINTVSNVLNSPSTTILDDNVAYTLTNTIAAGSKITVTVNTAAVVNLNITKA